ncbi:type II secretion system F family protein [Streptomyces sp. NBC_00237]|uniref:type II secretion system F family protein n=1 Tax=Streptomyces sp. NBC_00237 TaxID=2975687 RepID=UPI0022532C06|nr:type II secretion system F family protein [Streptomyces sp. NBC_00237]MCX5206894.1 type II secretion system F family protein [Streptomyces sp. NBC_00237]
MTALLLGLGLGGFLALAVYGLNPPRPSLAESLARLGRPSAIPRPEPSSPGGEKWAYRWGRRGVPVLRACGLPTAKLRRDLLVAEVSVEQFLAEKAVAGLLGFLAPSVLSLLLWGLTGAGMDWQLSGVASLAFGAGLFFAPDLSVRATAARRRKELRHTLSVFLNLTVIALAGGAGVHQALADAGANPQGWAAAQLRRALTAAEVGRTNVWHELGGLGTRTGVRELVELAATISLAGSEGAKIRVSLEAKASAMRTRALTEADGVAQSATERMSLPVVVLFGGFLVFIGYPAMQNVLAGL